jgi:hypothetical protein
MAFENLLDIPMPESELLEKLIGQVISSPFDENNMYYLKLERPNGESEISQIAWIKVFTDFDRFYDHHWESEYRRASIQLAARDNEYQILCQGFRLGDWVIIENSKVKRRCPYAVDGNIEEEKQISRELFENAFDELEVHLATAPKSIKAV